MNPIRETVRFEVEDLPELDTKVAIAGSPAQQEVGGALCLGVAAGIAVYLGSR